MPDVAFARWDPIRDLLAIQQRLDQYAPGPAGWTPPVDLLETTDQFIIKAELPGLRREDLNLSIEENRVTLSRTRRERPVASDESHRVAPPPGRLSRPFRFA